MIISHKHRFIFFAVPKTATHAIRQGLRPHLDKGDWEQQTLFGEQYLPIPELAALKHGHVSVREIKPHLTDDIWTNYFKFAFVRNPLERFVSSCFFLNRTNPEFEAQAVTFMRAAIQRPRFRQRVLGRPQAAFLINEAGAIGVDYVGRYESLQTSFDEICQRIGIATYDLRRKNTSQHDKYQKYLDADLRRSVADFYRDDLQLFGYAGGDV